MGILARLTREPRRPDEKRYPYTPRQLAGVVITPDIASAVPAVHACVSYISETVGVLPWRVLRNSPEGNIISPSHVVDWLLWKRPSPEWSSFQFRETMIRWALLFGNAVAEIERDQLGRPFALWPIAPWRVEFRRDVQTGRLVYEVENDAGQKIPLDPEDVFHVRAFGNGPVGISIVEVAAQSIGWARAAQLFGASFFGNGANLAGIVTMKRGLSPEGYKRLEAKFNALYTGVRNANKTAILDNDMDWKSIGTDPKNSQFVEIHHFLVTEICRWFAVPPHIVAELDRATFANIEHQGIEAVQRCIHPWVKRFEDEADYKLFGQNRLGFFTKINMNALMRGDVKSRGEWYKLMREVGAFSANRILELEDENTIGPLGDKHVMNSTYTTLDRIGEPPEVPAQPDPMSPDSTDPNVGNHYPEDDPSAMNDLLDMERRLVLA